MSNSQDSLSSFETSPAVQVLHRALNELHQCRRSGVVWNALAFQPNNSFDDAAALALVQEIAKDERTKVMSPTACSNRRFKSARPPTPRSSNHNI